MVKLLFVKSFFLGLLLLPTPNLYSQSANFSGTPVNNCSPLNVTFTDLSTGPITTWLWDFGDGNTSNIQNPSHIYITPGNYTVSLTVSGGSVSDTQTLTNYIKVKSPLANFSLNPPLNCSTPATIFFTDQSILPDIWSWNFGDGGTSTAQNPIHTYTSPGEYQVKLTVIDTNNGCSSVHIDSVKVSSLIANFSGTSLFGCAPITTSFTDLSTSTVGGAVDSWSWDFGDGSTSTQQNPTHNYSNPGIYSISLTVGNSEGCTKSHTKTNYVQAIGPNVNFGSADTVGNCIPHTMNFTDSSSSGSPIVSRAWNFGDGGTSSVLNPTHVYNTPGSFDVSLTVTDLDGCSKTVIFPNYVNISDNITPTITCPSNQNVDVDGSCQYSLTDFTGLATVTDNCSYSLTQSPISGTVITTTQTLTVTATDGAGNSAFCTFDVVPLDITPPTITCPVNQNVDFDNACQFTLPDYTGLATASDNCTVSLSQSPASSTAIATSQTIILTATDGAGNSSTCSFDVIPSDNTAPTITCPANQNVDYDDSCQYAILDYSGLVIVNDNCSVTLNQSPIAGTSISTTQTITMTAIDGHGNSTSCNFDIVPADNTAPIINCPSDQNVSLDASCQYTLSDYTGIASGSDNCSFTLSQSPTTGTNITTNQIITITATDGAGNSTNCTFSVLPSDTENPTITCPGDISQSNDMGICGAIITYSNPIDNDNCSGSTLTQTAGMANGTLFPVGSTVNTFIVTDGAGNSASCSFNVTISDNENPTITCPDAIKTCDSIITFSDPVSVDNCTGETLTFTNGLPSGALFPVGLTTNSYLVTDGAGNTSNCSFDIIRLIQPTVNAGPDLFLDPGFSEVIDVSVTDVTEFTWSPGLGLDNPNIEDPVTQPEQTTLYTITVSSADGCQSSDQILVNVEGNIEINNYLSPNNDGKNDTWIIKGNYLLDDCSIQIYDSWGNRILEQTGYANDWDGNGLPEGIYFYVISCGTEQQKTGSITLIR